MSDTLITVIAIVLAAILMFIFPLMTMADRTDDVAKLAVQTATTEFVDNIRTTGKITKANYDKYVEAITATGNLYDVEIEVQVQDVNLAKKKTQVQSDKTGENVYYTLYTAQILDEINKNGVYYCNEGDIVSVSAKNTSATIAEQIVQMAYSFVGQGSSSINAEAAGIVTTPGK